VSWHPIDGGNGGRIPGREQEQVVVVARHIVGGAIEASSRQIHICSTDRYRSGDQCGPIWISHGFVSVLKCVDRFYSNDIPGIPTIICWLAPYDFSKELIPNQPAYVGIIKPLAPLRDSEVVCKQRYDNRFIPQP
jgi:hypothetical protein